MKTFLRFVAIQLVSIVAMLVFAFVLIPFCLWRAWTGGAVSIKDGRPIDRWKYRWLQAVAGNPEDGVSGQTAKLIGGGPYMPGADDRWRAYCWSALRNSVDQLKYLFAYADGPLVTWQWKVPGTLWYISGKAGWQPENGYNVPVFSPLKVHK